MPNRHELPKTTWLPWFAGVGLFIVLLATGCSRKPAEATTRERGPRAGGVMRVLLEPPEALDPAISDEVYESVFMHQVYEGLLSQDTALRIQPCLASSWTISPDGLTYTFEIRAGAAFHDGSRLQAADVVRSLERCLTPEASGKCLAESYLLNIRGAAAFQAGRAARVEGIEALDERTLRIQLEAPVSMFLKVLAMDQTMVVAPRMASTPAGSGHSSPMGTGPFRFVEQRADRTVVLARFDEYWREPAYLDSLLLVPEEPLRGGPDAPRPRGLEIKAVTTGFADFVQLGAQNSGLAREAGLSVYRSPELSLAFLGLRCDTPPLDVPAVRRAILAAIHYDSLVSLDREALIPVSGLLPPGLPGREPGNHIPPANPTLGRSLLAEAGHPDGKGLAPLRIGITPGATTVRMMEMIERDLEAIGLDVRIEIHNWRELESMTLDGTLPAFVMSWVADLPDPDAFLYPLFHSSGNSNMFAYSSAVTDDLLAKGRALPPGQERNRIYSELQDVILGDAPLIPLYHSSLACAWTKEYQGIEIGACGFALVPFRLVYKVESPDLAGAQDGGRP